LRETGGGLRHAIPLLGQSPVLTLNTDAVWRGPNPINLIMQSWRNDMEALLLLVPPDQAHGHKGRGDFYASDNGQLTRGPGAIYTGLQMVCTETLNDVEGAAFSMNVIWDDMAARGGLYGVMWSGQWCDVGQPDSIAIAERMLDV
jgi:MurNAc alpha-1-phosphate uridylyltransferase